MFSIEELNGIIGGNEFLSDYSFVQQSLVNSQARQSFLFSDESTASLSYLTEAILASIPTWDIDEGFELCKIGGEIAEVLSTHTSFDEETKKRFRFRAVLLYELANMPAISSTLLQKDDYKNLSELFSRKNAFKFLSSVTESSPELTSKGGNFLELALAEDAFAYGEYAQGRKDKPDSIISLLLTSIGKEVSLDLSASELAAFAEIMRRRFLLSTRT